MKAIDMDAILEPLLAILAIVVPLGLAYVIVLWQSRKPACGCRKVSAITRDDLLQKRTELSRAEEKHAAR
jgi:hypothetical protein